MHKDVAVTQIGAKTGVSVTRGRAGDLRRLPAAPHFPEHGQQPGAARVGAVPAQQTLAAVHEGDDLRERRVDAGTRRRQAVADVVQVISALPSR